MTTNNIYDYIQPIIYMTLHITNNYCDQPLKMAGLRSLRDVTHDITINLYNINNTINLHNINNTNNSYDLNIANNYCDRPLKMTGLRPL